MELYNVLPTCLPNRSLFGSRWVHTSLNSTIEPTGGNGHIKRDVGDSAKPQVTGAMIFTHSEYHSRITLGLVYHQTKHNYDTVLVGDFHTDNQYNYSLTVLVN